MIDIETLKQNLTLCHMKELLEHGHTKLVLPKTKGKKLFELRGDIDMFVITKGS